jgi:hypothetical protein
MGNKIVNTTEAPIVREPELVEAIVEVLTKDMEAIEALLVKKDLFEKK